MSHHATFKTGTKPYRATFSAEKYLYLFDKPCGVSGEKAHVELRHDNVAWLRTKTITSGNVVECEIYPLWRTKNEVRAARAHTTREAQRSLNARNARKNLTRKINANFTEDDVCITLTYKDEVPNEEQARRDIRNYIRRIRDYRKKNDLPELKYVYVIEFDNGDTGRPKKRVHHHVVMSGMDRDEAERIWGKGYANTRRLQSDEYGFEALARYMTKDPSGSKRWCASRNLIDPNESATISDTKISKKQAEKLAAHFVEAAPAIFSKAFPECDFIDCEIRRSDFVAGAYIYARMHRKKQSGKHEGKKPNQKGRDDGSP